MCLTINIVWIYFLKKKGGFVVEANEKVIEALKSAGKPLKSAEIAEMAGVDKKEVDKAIKKLKADGVVESPKNCFYALKA